MLNSDFIVISFNNSSFAISEHVHVLIFAQLIATCKRRLINIAGIICKLDFISSFLYFILVFIRDCTIALIYNFRFYNNN